VCSFISDVISNDSRRPNYIFLVRILCARGGMNPLQIRTWGLLLRSVLKLHLFPSKFSVPHVPVVGTVGHKPTIRDYICNSVYLRAESFLNTRHFPHSVFAHALARLGGVGLLQRTPVYTPLALFSSSITRAYRVQHVARRRRRRNPH